MMRFITNRLSIDTLTKLNKKYHWVFLCEDGQIKAAYKENEPTTAMAGSIKQR